MEDDESYDDEEEEEDTQIQEESKQSEKAPDFDKWCTASFVGKQKIKQIPYYSEGSFVCEPCAKFCRLECQGQQCKEQKVYYFPYQCQCNFMAGGC